MPECFLPFSHRTYLNPPKAPGIPKLCGKWKLRSWWEGGLEEEVRKGMNEG